MHKTVALLCVTVGMVLVNSTRPMLANSPVSAPIRQAELSTSSVERDLLGLDDQLWGSLNQSGDRKALLTSIDHSLRYLRTPAAQRAYQNYMVPGISQERVLRSLTRFRQLVVNSTSPEQLQAAVKQEFAFYESVGNDDRGTVFYTGYYEPIHRASRRRTAEFRYPLYKLPANFSSWKKPHPTRAQLEGRDGLLGNRSRLRGSELVWMNDRLQAFLVQVQGSARLQLTDGSTMTVGFAGATDYPYVSLGRELVKDGKLPLEGLNLPVLMRYFQQNPRELSNYIPRNQRFIFFKNTNGAPATGSINVPVTTDRSIATDKSLMPPGALALVHTQLPQVNNAGTIEQQLVSRYVLDQDTGSAIRGPGRVDFFTGTGKVAGDRAGVTGSNGKLYYLLLRE